MGRNQHSANVIRKASLLNNNNASAHALDYQVSHIGKIYHRQFRGVRDVLNLE
ncbi:MAG: hypothetical protein LBG57_08585 [Treponema sp.]|nr:hypothetical protein [Treponema sp.]